MDYAALDLKMKLEEMERQRHPQPVAPIDPDGKASMQ